MCVENANTQIKICNQKVSVQVHKADLRLGQRISYDSIKQIKFIIINNIDYIIFK